LFAIRCWSSTSIAVNIALVTNPQAKLKLPGTAVTVGTVATAGAATTLVVVVV